MQKISKPPFILAVAGLDPSGGAGIAADILAASACGCIASAVAAALTVQSPSKYITHEPVDKDLLELQISALLADRKYGAVKTGLFVDAETVKTVADCLRTVNSPLVTDPVLKSTSGKKLYSDKLIESFKENLFPLATVITPNRRELELLTGQKTDSLKTVAKAASKLIAETGCKSVVVTGIINGGAVVDALVYKKNRTEVFRRERLKTGKVRGTGCRFSTVVACRLAMGDDVSDAVKKAGDILHNLLQNSLAEASENIKFIF